MSQVAQGRVVCTCVYREIFKNTPLDSQEHPSVKDKFCNLNYRESQGKIKQPSKKNKGTGTSPRCKNVREGSNGTQLEFCSSPREKDTVIQCNLGEKERVPGNNLTLLLPPVSCQIVHRLSHRVKVSIDRV